MATTLTKSYQKISTIGLSYGEIRTYAKYSSQSTENNTTSFQLKMTYYTSQANGVSFSSGSANLDGSTKSYGYTTMPKGETTILEVNRTLTHNTDGSSPNRNVTTTWSATFGGGGTKTATIVCPKINRYPTLTSAPNFSDEDNPTITYTTISGFSSATYSACISLTGAQADVPYREVSLSAGSYTFELTEAERNTLRNAIPNSNSTTVIFHLKTQVGSTSYYSLATRTMTIVNGNPTFTHSEVETTQKVIDVLGSSASTVVQNASVIRTTITPTALKGSSISKVVVVHNLEAQTKTASPYTFDIPISMSSFDIMVTDSRGNTTTEIVNKNMIEYQNVDITTYNFERENPTSSNVDLTLEARYYPITVGSTSNTPVFKWKLEESGTYTTIPSSAYAIDTTNNKVTISNYRLSNVLSHELSGQFFITLDDIFSSDSENMIVNKGIATYEAGEFDFQVNGDLIVADTEAENGVNILDEINNSIKVVQTSFTSSGSGTGWKYGSFTHTAPTGYKLIAVTTNNVKSADRNFFMFNINSQTSGSIYWAGYIGYGNYGANPINLIYVKDKYVS